jgi:MATE family multidrug resistance protein
MTPLRTELRALYALCWPATVTQVGLMLIGVVDTLFVARLGADDLAAAALAHMWQWSTMSLGLGAVMGTDPMISQAHGRADHQAAALGLQRGLILAVIASVPVCIAMWLTPEVLRAIGQPAAIAELAGRYNVLRIPTVPCFLLFTAYRMFLQARGLMGPATNLLYAANVINALGAWALTFGHLGAPRLGFDGAALAGSLTSVALLLGLHVMVRLPGVAIPRPWDRASFAPDGLWEVLRIGGPVGLQLWLEAFAFTFATFMVGWINVASVGAHQIALNLASLTFMVPLGVSMGASARVGNLIGADDVDGMRRAVRIALMLGAGAMLFSGLGLTLLRFQLPRLYTDDAALIAMAAQVLPLAGAFQLSDGTQVVAAGVLRGMGRPHAATLINLLGYYLLALPLGYLLAFPLGLGLRGIWYGLIAGLVVVSVALLLWVQRTARRPLAELRVG